MIGARAKVDANVGERRAKKVAVCIELLVVVRCSTGSQSNSMRNLVNSVKSSRGCVLTSQEEGRDIDVTLGKVDGLYAYDLKFIVCYMLHTLFTRHEVHYQMLPVTVSEICSLTSDHAS